jgi:hypothetical protein
MVTLMVAKLPLPSAVPTTAYQLLSVRHEVARDERTARREVRMNG